MGNALADIYRALTVHFGFQKNVGGLALWLPKASRKSSAPKR